jgi:hypothetical protein
MYHLLAVVKAEAFTQSRQNREMTRMSHRGFVIRVEIRTNSLYINIKKQSNTCIVA